MGYPEYTKCTTVNGALTHMKSGSAPWNDMIAAGVAAAVVNGAAVVIVAGILDAATAALAGGAIVISLLIGALIALVTYCDWWLKYRLICLDGNRDHCVVGFVAETESAAQKTGFDAFDTDFTMNIGIAGTWFSDNNVDMYKLDEASSIQPFGYLLNSTAENDPQRAANDPISQTMQFDLTGTNSPGDDQWSPYFGQPKMKVLHVEFEGAGVPTLRKWLLGLIALLVVADALSIACSAGLLWACVLLAFLALAFISLASTGVNAALDDQANPGDIDKSLGNLSVGNVVLVRGRWIYDAGHVDENRGWNEIHPIRYCQIIDDGVFKGDWGTLKFDEWCEQVDVAASPSVKVEQAKAENSWVIHPVIDGCVTVDRPPAKRDPRIDAVSNIPSYNNCSGNYKIAASVTAVSGISKVELWYRFSAGPWQSES